MEGLSIICAGLGIIEEDDDGNRIGYTKGDYCLDNLKDLLRFLRRDDPQTREVFKQVCKWNIVGKDLIPIIEYCQDDRNLLLNAVKVMVFLTMPIEPTSNDIPQQIELLWGIKSSITFSEAVPVIMSLLESPLENLACEAFTEDDWKMVQLVLTLFRNVLAIQDISTQQKSGGSMIEFVFLRDRFLELLFKENIMEVILVLSQQVGGSCSYLRHDNLLLLETFYFIFMGQLPELIAKAHFKDPKVDEDNDTSINSLKDIMEEERQKRKVIRQRNLGCYTQFSGTFTRFSLDGSKTLIKGNPCSVSNDPLIIAHTKHRGPAKRTVWDQGRVPATNNKILNLLYDFINQFLGGGYNVLMQSVRDDIEKEHHAIQNSDIVIFFQVAQFVTSFQYNKFLNQPHEEVDAQEPMDSRAGSTLYRGCICGPIAESLNISMFQLILSRWCFSLETLKETNDCKFLYVAGSLIKTMLLMLELVLKQSPEDSKEHRTSRILLYKLFYDQTEEGMTQFLLTQIKSFDTHKQAKSYLADLVEIINTVIKLMENLQARGSLRISKKLRKKRPKTAVKDDKKENDDEMIRDSASVGLPVGGSSHEFRDTGLAHNGEDAIDSNKIDEHIGCTKVNEDQMVVESTDTTHNNAAGSGSEKSNNLHVVGKGEEDITMLDQVNQHVPLEAQSGRHQNTQPETQQKLSDDVNDDYSSGDENVLTTEDDLKISALVSTLAGLSQIRGGFGYDRLADDYKVVTIAQLYHPDAEPSLVSETMVFSLKLDVWKKVQDCPYWLLKEDNGTCAGGALHWIVTKEPSAWWSPLILVGLNLQNGTFQEVEYPEDLGNPQQINLAVLGECLCLLKGHLTCSNAKNHVLDRIDVWMMKDYGVKESWVKLFSVEQLEGRQHFRNLRPITYSVTGKEVLMEMDNRKFLWYSLERKSLKYAKMNSKLDTFESIVCLGSLVPLYGGRNEKDRKKGIEQRE